MRTPIIVTTSRPKRRSTSASPKRTEPLPVIVSARQPSRIRRQLALDDDTPVPAEVRAFFARNLRRPE